MTRSYREWFRPNWLGLVLAIVYSLGPEASADSLKWNGREKKLDAQIESADLPHVLRKLASATGWNVYVEPNTQQSVSVRFKNLPAGEALRRLLGDLNFALLPQTNGPASLFIFRTSMQQATQLLADGLRNEHKHQGPIPNELIVTLRPGSGESIEELAKRLGAKVIGRVDALNTYRLQFADQAAAQDARTALGTDPNVAATDSNYPVDQPTRMDPLQLSAASAFSLKAKQAGNANQLVVGLIDTPLQPLDAKMSQFLLPAMHVAGDPSLPPDQLTHGTTMAETILSGLTFAPQENGGSSVRILPVDVYGNSPDTTTFNVAQGVYAAVGAGATVINLSLGGDGNSQFLADMIHAAHQQGVLFFGAAGNQPTPDPTYPAAYPDVVAVTAADRGGTLASYADYGSFVDVIAPGSSIVDFQGEAYLVRGTSAATAYVTGAAAGYRANGSTPQNVEEYIRQSMAFRRPAAP
jgi:hypothetical protein